LEWLIVVAIAVVAAAIVAVEFESHKVLVADDVEVDDVVENQTDEDDDVVVFVFDRRH
jgi:hypothetical protein